MNWPTFLPPRPDKAKLGAEYNTDWAREPAACKVRSWMLKCITRPFVQAVARPTVLNVDRVTNLQGPVIFAPNHASHVDTSLVLMALPERYRYRAVVAAGADYFFDKQWKAALWALWINIIPIEREKVGRKSADLAARLISEGWNLVIFPEGGRSMDDFVAPFRGGAAYLSVRCNVPVVPVHIEGTRSILGKGARKLTPGPTRVTFGTPLVAREGEKARDFNRRIEQAVAVAADEARTDWWSAKKRAISNTTPSLGAPEGVSGWRKSWLGSKKAARVKRSQWPINQSGN